MKAKATVLSCSRRILLAVGLQSAVVLMAAEAHARPVVHAPQTVTSDKGAEASAQHARPRHNALFEIKDQDAFIAQVCRQIELSAKAYGLPPAFLAKLIWKESRFDPNAISPMGAEGIAQFMPSTAKRHGLDNTFEPMAAILASAKLLAKYEKAYGNLGLAAAAYNAGTDRVDSWRAGQSGLPWETRGYVYSITGHRAREWKGKTIPKVNFVLDGTRPFGVACNELRMFRAPLLPYFANTYYNRGLALAKRGDFKGAIIKYTIAIRLKPKFPDAYNNRGLVYRQMGDYERAIANYDAAIRLKPKDWAAYNNRGYAYRKLARYAEAIKDYDKAIKLRPGYVIALFNRAFAKAQLGHYKGAIRDYDRVIRRQPKHATAHYNRALAYLETGQTGRAEADFDRAIAANPKFAQAYYMRAVLMLRLGKTKRALADYQKSAALDPTFGNERYRKTFE